MLPEQYVKRLAARTAFEQLLRMLDIGAENNAVYYLLAHLSESDIRKDIDIPKSIRMVVLHNEVPEKDKELYLVLARFAEAMHL
jgi:hypothetical protein